MVSKNKYLRLFVFSTMLLILLLNRHARHASQGALPPNVAQSFPSPNGNRPHISPVPLLVYGHQSASTAKAISEASTVSCLAVERLDNLDKVLDGRPLAGLLAMSPRDTPGEAGKAIAMYHARYPKGMALYSSWNYNVEHSAKQAIEYHAQGIVMPGIESKEMMNYIIQIGRRTEGGEPAPVSVAAHEALLREYAPHSPFWQMQDRPGGPSY